MTVAANFIPKSFEIKSALGAVATDTGYGTVREIVAFRLLGLVSTEPSRLNI